MNTPAPAAATERWPLLLLRATHEDALGFALTLDTNLLALRAAYDAASDQTGFLIDYALEHAHPEPTRDFDLVYEHCGVHAAPGGSTGTLIERHYQAPGALRVRVRLATRLGIEPDTLRVRAEAHAWNAASGWLEVLTLSRTIGTSEVEDTLEALTYELLGVTDWVTRP